MYQQGSYKKELQKQNYHKEAIMQKNRYLHLNSPVSLCCLLTMLFVLLPGNNVFADERSGHGGKKFNKWHHKKGACSQTTKLAYKACQSESSDDYWIGIGNCANLSSKTLRKECLEVTEEEYTEAKELCDTQREAREEICDYMGQMAYDPLLDPANFVDPTTIDNTSGNPYWPLVVGTQWRYEGETDEGLETITVTITDNVKEIEYPAESGHIFLCREVRDIVDLDGTVIEDTRDWYAQDAEGNVWYFGEIAQNYEGGELVDLEGSWKAGVSYAKPGIVMYASPEKAKMYRQEFLLGDAEDMALIWGVNEVSVDTAAGYFEEDVLETEEWTPLEPNVKELKYYVPGIGMVFEEKPESGEIVELVEIIKP